MFEDMKCLCYRTHRETFFFHNVHINVSYSFMAVVKKQAILKMNFTSRNNSL